jgi:hypothetical protein
MIYAAVIPSSAGELVGETVAPLTRPPPMSSFASFVELNVDKDGYEREMKIQTVDMEELIRLSYKANRKTHCHKPHSRALDVTSMASQTLQAAHSRFSAVECEGPHIRQIWQNVWIRIVCCPCGPLICSAAQYRTVMFDLRLVSITN